MQRKNKVITVQFVNVVNERGTWYDMTNSEILKELTESDREYIEYIFGDSPQIAVIAVNDGVLESEVDNGDSTGETDGTTELHEVPC